MRLAVALLVLALPSVASARPSAERATTLASYCSPSGDVCYGLIRRNGVVRAELTTAAQVQRTWSAIRAAARAAASGSAWIGPWNVGTGSLHRSRLPAEGIVAGRPTARRVRPPGSGGAGLLRCGSFPVFRQSGSTWGSSVRLARQFPLLETGICRVTWKLASGPLGPTLRFRIR